MPKVNSNMCLSPRRLKASHNNDFCDLELRHSVRSKESFELSELDRTLALAGEGRVRNEKSLTTNVINSHVIVSQSGRQSHQINQERMG